MENSTDVEIDSKGDPAVFDERLAHETKEVEATDQPVVHPSMTFGRFMALFSLVWLITTSATPLLFITATLCMSPSRQTNLQLILSPTLGGRIRLGGSAQQAQWRQQQSPLSPAPSLICLVVAT